MTSEFTPKATARSAGHRGLLLMVDELQDADPAGLRALCYGWQRIKETPNGLPAGVIAAALPNIRGVLRQHVSNSERLQIRQLGILAPGASAAALVDPARALNLNPPIRFWLRGWSG